VLGDVVVVIRARSASKWTRARSASKWTPASGPEHVAPASGPEHAAPASGPEHVAPASGRPCLPHCPSFSARKLGKTTIASFRVLRPFRERGVVEWSWEEQEGGKEDCADFRALHDPRPADRQSPGIGMGY
jgi:hypothetical protein